MTGTGTRTARRTTATRARPGAVTVPEPRDRVADILDASLVLLARGGIGALSMRAVASAAGVSLGLANYHFADKTSLVCAALERIGEQDLEIVTAEPELPPLDRLRRALRRVGEPRFVEPGYVATRLQMWSLAAADPRFAEINRVAQQRYLDRLTELVAAARPLLDADEVARRAGEILVLQNGIWLTAAIIDDAAARERVIERTVAIAVSARTGGTP